MDKVRSVSLHTFEAYVFHFNQRNSVGQIFTPDTQITNLKDFTGLRILYPALKPPPEKNFLIEVAEVVRWRVDEKGLWIRGRWHRFDDANPEERKLVAALKTYIKRDLMDIGLTYSLHRDHTEIDLMGEVLHAIIPSLSLYPRS